MINDTTRLPARASRRLIETIEETQFARSDFVTGGFTCTMRARFVARHHKRISVLITLESSHALGEHIRKHHMQESLDALYSIYERVTLLHLDSDRAEPIFSRTSFYSDAEDGLCKRIERFVQTEVFDVDKDRFRAFIDPSTLAARLHNLEQNFLACVFRSRSQGGNFTWKIALIIAIASNDDEHFLFCLRSSSTENDVVFKDAFKTNKAPASIPHEQDAVMEEVDLWNALLGASQYGIFWKDTNRRFVGCNQVFLDYYGFSSEDAILGKTDEDMGWHINPVPYQADEERVLRDGIATKNVSGQCIIRGELHDITATKRPVYHNGRIVGLVGYFVDSNQIQTAATYFQSIPNTDQVTGTLNYIGLEAATERYAEAALKNGTDFAMLVIDIDDFKRFNELFGYEFGDRVLHTVASTIREIVPNNCVIGHVTGNRFVLLLQHAKRSDLDALGNQIVTALGSIARIDDTPCTIFARFASAVFSEVPEADAENLRALVRARMYEQKLRS